MQPWGSGNWKVITVLDYPSPHRSLPCTAILALDLGKYKSVACHYTGDPDSVRFESTFQVGVTSGRVGRAPARPTLPA